MRDLLNRLFSTSAYTDPALRQRARVVYATTLLQLLGMSAVYSRQTAGMGAMLPASGDMATTYALAFFVFGVGVIVLARSGRLGIASLGSLMMLTGGWCMVSILSGFTQASDSLPFAMLMALGGLLLGRRGLLLTAALSLLMVIFALSPRQDVAIETKFSVLIGLAVVAGLVAAWISTQRAAEANPQIQGAEDRLKLTEINRQIARRIANRAALSEVLSEAVEQVTLSYPRIYHTQIFLIDERGETARLAASTGTVGRLLLQRKHALGVGSESVIGRVTATGEVVVARAGSPNSIHRRNEFLPETVVEAAFPLRTGQTIIGALDLQSKIDGAIRDEEIPLFQALADNIAIAIDNARLVEERERQLEENRRLVEQTQQAVQEVQRLNRQLTGRAWDRFLDQRSDIYSLGIDYAQDLAYTAPELSENQREAMAREQLVTRRDGRTLLVAAPVHVRGEVIGAFELEFADDTRLAPEDLELIERVAERLGLAAETTRLFEESRRLAYREMMVNEISARLQTASNVETMLAEAARSLQQTLNVGKVAIRLGSPPGVQSQENGVS